MTYSSVPVAITEILPKKFLCSRFCFRKPSFQTLIPPLFIPKRNKSSKTNLPLSESLRFNSNKRARMNASEMPICSLRSWRDFARECICFSCEAENARGEAVRGLVKSRVEFHSIFTSLVKSRVEFHSISLH